jgi:hypothetical protein
MIASLQIVVAIRIAVVIVATIAGSRTRHLDFLLATTSSTTSSVISGFGVARSAL